MSADLNPHSDLPMLTAPEPPWVDLGSGLGWWASDGACMIPRGSALVLREERRPWLAPGEPAFGRPWEPTATSLLVAPTEDLDEADERQEFDARFAELLRAGEARRVVDQDPARRGWIRCYRVERDGRVLGVVMPLHIQWRLSGRHREVVDVHGREVVRAR